MFARFRVRLPFEFYVPVNTVLQPVTAVRHGFTATIHQPYQSAGYGKPLPRGEYRWEASEVAESLAPTTEGWLSEVVRDGVAHYRADALQIDFARHDLAQPEFGSDPEAIEPRLQLCISVANQYLEHVRVARTLRIFVSIRALDEHIVEFVGDDGALMPENTKLVRRYLSQGLVFHGAFADAELRETLADAMAANSQLSRR